MNAHHVCRRRWRSNPSGKCSQERLTRGTVTSTMRRAAHPSARCGAGAGCSATQYQSLCTRPKSSCRITSTTPLVASLTLSLSHTHTLTHSHTHTLAYQSLCRRCSTAPRAPSPTPPPNRMHWWRGSVPATSEPTRKGDVSGRFRTRRSGRGCTKRCEIASGRSSATLSRTRRGSRRAPSRETSSFYYYQA